MSKPEPSSFEDSRSSREAMVWMSRVDRGLTPAEQDEFFSWLAASPANGESFTRCRRRWRSLDQLADWRPECSLAPNRDLLAPRPRRFCVRRLWPGLLAAACVTLVLALWQRSGPGPMENAAVAMPRPENRLILPDQSVMKLNDGASYALRFTQSERRIHLERGEAFFQVTKDPDRPFIVEVAGVTVRAIGTAFNVRIAGDELDVLVAEGKVEVVPAPVARSEPGLELVLDPTVLRASQRVSLSLRQPPEDRHIATLTRREIQQTLAWQHGLMTFRDQPLEVIVDEINRLNYQQILLMDAPLAAMRFSGTIRSDNVEGFVRLLQLNFGAEVLHEDGTAIHVRTRSGSD